MTEISNQAFGVGDCDNPKKMRGAEKSFMLSNFAHLDIIDHAVDSTYNINLTKKPFDKNITTATLTAEEWKELTLILPDVKEVAQRGWNEIQEGKTPSLNQLHRILSDRFMLILNSFLAPNGNSYITTSIRLYYYGTEGQMLPRWDGGISLSYQELTCLVDQLDEINGYISAVLSNVKTFILRSMRDVFSVQRFVEDFWKNGTENGSCCHLFLEKKIETSSIGS